MAWFTQGRERVNRVRYQYPKPQHVQSWQCRISGDQQ